MREREHVEEYRIGNGRSGMVYRPSITSTMTSHAQRVQCHAATVGTRGMLNNSVTLRAPGRIAGVNHQQGEGGVRLPNTGTRMGNSVVGGRKSRRQRTVAAPA